jgi:hypothetical protein
MVEEPGVLVVDRTPLLWLRAVPLVKQPGRVLRIRHCGAVPGSATLTGGGARAPAAPRDAADLPQGYRKPSESTRGIRCLTVAAVRAGPSPQRRPSSYRGRPA